MKYKLTKCIATIAILIICSFVPLGAVAADDEPPSTDEPVDAPLDGGVSILAAAGVAYGAKKWKERRKVDC